MMDVPEDIDLAGSRIPLYPILDNASHRKMEMSISTMFTFPHIFCKMRLYERCFGNRVFVHKSEYDQMHIETLRRDFFAMMIGYGVLGQMLCFINKNIFVNLRQIDVMIFMRQKPAYLSATVSKNIQMRANNDTISTDAIISKVDAHLSSMRAQLYLDIIYMNLSYSNTTNELIMYDPRYVPPVDMVQVVNSATSMEQIPTLVKYHTGRNLHKEVDFAFERDGGISAKNPMLEFRLI